MITIEPEPTDQEREAIVAALAAGAPEELGSWEQTALDEGVEDTDVVP